MTPEQLQWDKKQWAQYLECSVQMYKRSRNFTESKYFVSVKQDTDRKYRVVLQKKTYEKNRYGQWRICGIIQKISTEAFDKYDDAVQHANTIFIPGLVFTPEVAETLHVPTKILQTLHVNQR